MSALRDALAALAKLETLLQREGADLRAGRIVQAGDVAAEKNALCMMLEARIEALEATPRDERLIAAARRVDGLARDNERLLEAAKTGAADARARLAAMAERSRKVGVYGQAGSQLMMPEANVTKKKTA
ncbi:MAG: hypothetical protein AAGC56_06385 [Pseudomonadota bacterium]